MLSILLILCLCFTVIAACDVQQGEQGPQGEKGEQGETGAQGPQGEDGITPMLRVNPDNNEWEVSYYGGKTWTSLGVKVTVSEETENAAKEQARVSLMKYLIKNNGEIPEYMLYDADNSWVALHNGAIVGVYKSREDAVAAFELTGGKFVANNGDNFWVYCKTENGILSGPTTDTVGKKFSASSEFIMSNDLSATPLTYEAWIKLPENYATTDITTTRGGVILGNYKDSGTHPTFSFEIAENGWPKLYYLYSRDNSATIIFNQVKVNTGGWVHLSIVNDVANEQLICYVNGEAKQTVSYDATKATTEPLGSKQYKSIEYKNRTDAKPIIEYTKPIIGNDYRNEANNCFKGKIRAIAVYSDVRTQNELKSDISSFGEDSLIAAWNLRQASADGIINDISGNGHNANADWIVNKEPVTDYAYSFAVVGDTQSVNYYDPDNFSKIYDWIVANKDEKKIEYVMGLGDITDTDAQDEWARAAAAFDSLAQADIPYSVVIGNHDGVTNSTKKNEAFNNAISTDYYNSSLDGKYDENMDNTWRKIEVNGRKYLIFTLGFGANDDILNWASEIIEANQDHNVIITLHAYMYRDGTTLGSNDKYPPSANDPDRYGKDYNDGDDIYEKLIKNHSNIVMVLSGHDPYPYIVYRTDNGVVQMLSDHQYVDRDLNRAGQATTGMVTMFYISEDGETVTVECYSTVYEMYYGAKNQFTFTLNVVD